MACGPCKNCGTDTHIELFDDAHVVAAGLEDAHICLKCEAALYRAFYGCTHKNRARCKECEDRYHTLHAGQ
jgi:hypothetical protein